MTRRFLCPICHVNVNYATSYMLWEILCNICIFFPPLTSVFINFHIWLRNSFQNPKPIDSKYTFISTWVFLMKLEEFWSFEKCQNQVDNLLQDSFPLAWVLSSFPHKRAWVSSPTSLVIYASSRATKPRSHLLLLPLFRVKGSEIHGVSCTNLLTWHMACFFHTPSF